MTKLVALMLVFVVLGSLTSCVTNTHIIGRGPQGTTGESVRQWYALWGLIDINEVDTAQMAGGTANYKIVTQYAPLDVLINIFAGIVTVNARSVTVTK